MSLPTINKQTHVQLYPNSSVSSDTPEDGALAFSVDKGLRLRDNSQWFNLGTKTIVYVFDGNGSALVASVGVPFRVPYNCTIVSWSINAKSTDSSPTATVKVWKKATGTASPSSSDSINTSGVQLTTGTAKTSTTVSDFTTVTIVEGDYLVIELSAVANATQIGFTLEVRA